MIDKEEMLLIGEVRKILKEAGVIAAEFGGCRIGDAT